MQTTNQDIKKTFEHLGKSMDEYRKLHMNAAQQLTQLQLDFLNLCMDCNSTQLQRLSRADSTDDMLAVESGVAAEYMNKFFQNAQNVMETLSKNQEEIYSWMQSSSLENFSNNAASDTAGKSGKKPAVTAK